MEINDEVLNEMAKDLTMNGLNNAMSHSQDMMMEVKKIIKEVSDKNPEATREEIIEASREILDARMADKTVEDQAMQNDEDARD